MREIAESDRQVAEADASRLASGMSTFLAHADAFLSSSEMEVKRKEVSGFSLTQDLARLGLSVDHRFRAYLFRSVLEGSIAEARREQAGSLLQQDESEAEAGALDEINGLAMEEAESIPDANSEDFAKFALRNGLQVTFDGLNFRKKKDKEDKDDKEGEKKTPSPAEEAEDNEEYLKFWKEFAKAIKLGLYEDSSNRTKLAKLLRFQTSKSGDNFTSLEKYISRMKKGQKHIYYISGETKDAVEKSPFLERLRKKDLEVLYYVDPIDEYAMPQLTEFKGFQFMGANKENLKLDDDETEEKKLKKLTEMHKKLTDWMKETLGTKIEKAVVSNRLLETPAIIVSSQYGWSTNMERIMKAQTMGSADRSQQMTSQKTLEINPSHPIIRELKSRVENDGADQEAKDIAHTLFDVALVGTGLTPNDPAEFASRVQVLMRLGLGVSKDAPIEEPEVVLDPEPEKKDDKKADDKKETDKKADTSDPPAKEL